MSGASNRKISLRPIGRVLSPRSDLEDDFWGGIRSTIELDPERVHPTSVTGIEEFSHLEVVFLLHRVEPNAIHQGARRPRGRRDLPEVGILAQRAKARPNRIGVSRCRLLGVEGLRLHVQELDAVDGTPVLDIKPYFKDFGPRGEVTEPRWVSEVMADYYAVGGGSKREGSPARQAS